MVQVTASLRSAATRAARVSPAYRQFSLYNFAKDDRGRPDHNTFVLIATTYGNVRWKDTDDRLFSEAVGDALVSVIATDDATRPDAMTDEDGQIYVVKDAEGEDTLGIYRRYRVRRRSEDTPTTIAP